MTDCSSIHGSTSSSDFCCSRERDCDPSTKIRVIKLVRPHANKGRKTLIGQPTSTFGFSLRGGREFGTGFFVSHVVPGSEADRKDLRVGDQIIRIGGDLKGQGSMLYNVDDAVHRELTHFISHQDRLILKVRSVGIIPIKEKSTDQLIWHVVPLNLIGNRDQIRLDDIIVRDVRIVLNVAPRTKLGLGICKGPDWRPGIFVQFTKENSIARESGLRVGDQLLKINGIELSEHVSFNQAVAIMKNSNRLELIVRTGIGLDLFPDSSGYNSSASSVTGDQSPCWGDQASKRLSIVREESNSFNSCDRLGTFRPLNKDRLDLDRRKEKLLPVETPRVPPAYDSNTKGKNNTTIIKLSESGTVINNTLISNAAKNDNQTTNSSDDGTKKLAGNEDRKLANICFVSKQNETKVVTVEIHRSASMASSTVPPPPPAIMSTNGNDSIVKANPDDQGSSSEQSQSSLSSAISEELKRRAEKKQNAQSTPAAPEPTPKKLGPNPQFNAQHDALMDEFKKAHRKMFKNGFVESEKNGDAKDEADGNVVEKVVNVEPVKEKKKAPSPPPRVPSSDKPAPSPDYTMPSTPIPDYDTGTLSKNKELPKGTMGRVASSEMAKACGSSVELESLESFKMDSSIPNPPPTYFTIGPKSGPPTMKKIQVKPVSVIVGEYDGNMKKENGRCDINGNDMGSRLKSELEKSLWRSNLKGRSNSVENLLNTNELQKSKIDRLINDKSSKFVNNLIEDNVNKILGKSENYPLNGILKTVNKKMNSPVQTKNISFGDVK